MATHPLQQHPFHPVPGVDPNHTISQQIERIEQLNTLLLLDVDENFAKCHQAITSRILPQIKRYALAVEPVRGVTKFWRNFYEAAAEVHVQIASDDSLATHDEASEHDVDPEESFIFHGAESSTPMPGRTSHNNNHSQSYDESFSDSLASPFDTMDRRLANDLRIDDSDVATPSLPSGYNMSGLTQSSVATTPRAKIRTAQLAGQHGGSGTPRGVVDLRSTPLNARFKPKLSLADLDVDDDDYALNMSPPVTMQFQMPTTNAPIPAPVFAPALPSIESPAPARVDINTAQQIVKDLFDEMSDGYIPSPRMPTPEGLRRYSIMPPQPDEQSGSRTFRRSIANSSFDSDDVGEEQHIYTNDETFDSFASSPDQSMVIGHVEPQQGAPQQGKGPLGPFNLLKQDEMLTFFGGSLEEAAGREVADTPTNARLR